LALLTFFFPSDKAFETPAQHLPQQPGQFIACQGICFYTGKKMGRLSLQSGID
jgi:hypothetical protein